MRSLDQLLSDLWSDYAALNPQAQKIHDLLAARQETIVNDHIALRTFDDPRCNLEVLAQAFTRRGYKACGEYTFVEKKLFARHYEHTDERQPKVFISHLELAKCSDQVRQIVTRLLDQVPSDAWADPDLCAIGRPWQVSYEDYQLLAAESEYASWMSAFGFCANHFTILVNELRSVANLAGLNQLIKSLGFALNTSGGEIKGSREAMLEQSSTLAARVSVDFTDGPQTIPSCYYEFAQRYPGPDGRLYSGFVEKSADKIFESTSGRTSATK